MDRRTTPKTRADTGRSREDRLKSALKANLARRKAQMRARGDSDEGRDGLVDTPTDTDTDKE